MSNGFGAGFLTLAILAVLGGLAVVAGALAVAAVALRRGSRGIPGALRSLATGILLAIVVPAAFGVAALIDEAPVGAALLLVVVFVPLGAVAFDRRGTDWRLRTATAALAWSGPYLVATVAFIAVNAAVPIHAAPPIGNGWLAVGVAGVVAVVGSVAVGRWLAPVLAND